MLAVASVEVPDLLFIHALDSRKEIVIHVYLDDLVEKVFLFEAFLVLEGRFIALL